MSARSITASLLILACGCSRTRGEDPRAIAPRAASRASSPAVPPSPSASFAVRPLVQLSPGAFRVTELGSTVGGGARYLATSSETPPVCQFEVVIEKSKTAPATPFSFAEAALVRKPKSNCTAFLRGLARRLAFGGDLPKPPATNRLPVSIAILGVNQSRAPDDGEIAGSFSSNPPGNWTATKLFLADGEGEVFLNINAREGIGEFSIKDEDYAIVVITELAKILLPEAG